VPTTHLTLIGKPDCHLCEDALEVVTTAVTELQADAARGSIALEQLSILDDPELHARYVEDIPVVLIEGKVHTYWRVDPARLKSAVNAARDSARENARDNEQEDEPGEAR